jgi:Protein of unknown function (DUF2865)
MAVGGKTALRVAAGVIVAGLTLAISPAQAGIFERIFGSLSHALRAPARLPDAVREFAPPFELRPERGTNPSGQVEGGPATAFCVRTCDGQYFPVLAHRGMSVADACHAFCPASQTAIFTGGMIDGAVASNGSRYADLPNAFVYRQHLVAGCTCNGHDQFGLAHIDINNDPTLKPGDAVATAKGMAAFTGRQNQSAQFTPAGNYSHFSQDYRSQLSAMETSAPR